MNTKIIWLPIKGLPVPSVHDVEKLGGEEVTPELPALTAERQAANLNNQVKGGQGQYYVVTV